MLENKEFKKLLKKNKKMKLMENIIWEEEFDEKIQFIYFIFQRKRTYYAHIMLIIVYLEQSVEIEVINQHPNNEVEMISKELIEISEKNIKNENRIIEFKYIVNKKRFLKYLKKDQVLRKKMNRYLKK